MRLPALLEGALAVPAQLVDAALDASILWSFDRSGFLRHARTFRRGDLDVDLTGRVAVVTGANSGIGLATARALASRGAEVHLACRNRDRAEVAAEGLRRETANPRVCASIVDLSELSSVRAWCDSFPAPRLDVLVHNAGVLPEERRLTGDGLELTFATNVAGPFAMTEALRPRLAAAPGSRVVFVSSGGMYSQRLSLDDVDWTARPFDGVAAYAQTKRMQVVLARLLARRWARDGIAAHAMHPGWADTPAVRTSLPRFWSLMKNRLRSPEEGADTVAWLAIAEGLPSGGFWFDRSPAEVHLLPFTAEDPADRERLWNLLEDKTRKT